MPANAIREQPFQRHAATIGKASGHEPGDTTRIVGMLAGDQLPRIC